MKLYCEPSATTCRPVLLFAREHDLELDLEHVQLFEGEHLREDFGIIPSHAVPVLVEDDFKLTEASAILKYLAEAVGSPACPSDRQGRAQVNAWMDWFNTGFYRDFGYGMVYCRLLPNYAHPPAARAELLECARQRSTRWLDVLDQQIVASGGPFVLGEGITLADYLGSSYVTLGELVSFDFAPWRNVSRWLATMAARPAWAEVNAAFYGWSSAMRSQAA